MLYKSNGFFLAELLLSLSVWIMLTLFLLPLFVQVSKQSLNTQYSREAAKLLYDTLQEQLFTRRVAEDFIFESKGKSFLVNTVTSEKKVCVKYEDTFKNKKEICEVFE